MPAKIEISHRTIIFTLILLASLWLVFMVRDIIFLLFIAFTVMSALRPLVEFLEKYHIPRGISIIFIYILVFGLIGFTFSSLVPAFVSQTTKFIDNLPKYEAAIKPYYQIDIKSIFQQLAPIGQNVVFVVMGIFSNIITVITILVISFYLLLERKHMEKYLIKFMGKDKGAKAVNIVKSVELSLGSWLRGELILMLFIGLVAYIGLIFLRVDYALPLAIIAGLTEIVPVVGPLISGVPAVLIGFSISPLLGFATIALYFIIHQLENTFIVPQVMNRTVGLSPLITIIALMIGSTLAGGAGAILSIPVVVTLRAIIVAYLDKSISSEE
jgi:predicted PurR-regulated permease PerM